MLIWTWAQLGDFYHTETWRISCHLQAAPPIHFFKADWRWERCTNWHAIATETSASLKGLHVFSLVGKKDEMERTSRSLSIGVASS
jgi:hypothetical protein